MRYYIKCLINGTDKLHEHQDYGVKECSKSEEVQDIVRDMDKQGYDLVAKKALRELNKSILGHELYFESRELRKSRETRLEKIKKEHKL